jgi:hypothetical protein
MELVQLSYRILFEIRIEIEGVSTDTNQFIKIEPDFSTQPLLKRYHILSKQQKDGHVFLIETEPSGLEEETPRIELEVDEVFRFQIKFKDDEKIEGTHLRSYDWANDVLLVTNEANHVSGSEVLLSLPFATYSNADDYLPGFLVNSGGSSFKALQASDNADPHPVTETDYWKQITDATAISQEDLQLRSSLTFPVDLDTIVVVEIRHSPLLPPDYQLLDASDKCREVTYKINLLKQN